MSLAIAFSANAQSRVHRWESTTKHEAKKVAHQTERIASNGKSRVVDRVYKEKMAPNGRTVYIDKHSKYYWIDSRGHKMYVRREELRDRRY